MDRATITQCNLGEFKPFNITSLNRVLIPEYLFIHKCKIQEYFPIQGQSIMHPSPVITQMYTVFKLWNSIHHLLQVAQSAKFRCLKNAHLISI